MSLQRFGAAIVIMEHFDPVQCLELIERQKVTIAQFVPTMFTRLLSSRKQNENATIYRASRS